MLRTEVHRIFRSSLYGRRPMKTPEKCSRAEQLSRRNALKEGLSTAAAATIGQSAESLAESQAQGQSKARRAVSTEGVRSIDIHAHYYPQTYLEAIAEDGKRFDCEYRMTDQGFYTKTPAGNQGPLPTKFIDLKQRIAEMDATGVAVQAISLTTPMNYWGDAEISLKLAKTWNDGASAAQLAYPTPLRAS